MPRLFSYKLTHDTGFAPNPFWGFLTIATCKPLIRSAKRIGDWIAGFTSQELCGDPVGQERLVYLMQISEKIPFAEYFNNPLFKKKIPDLTKSQCLYKAGDNIYRPSSAHPSIREFEQLQNPYHDQFNKDRDLSGRFVLIANKFHYFGRKALNIPNNLRPNVPKGQSAHGALTHDQVTAQKFIEYIVAGWSAGVHSPPHSWPDGDNSWEV